MPTPAVPSATGSRSARRRVLVDVTGTRSATRLPTSERPRERAEGEDDHPGDEVALVERWPREAARDHDAAGEQRQAAAVPCEVGALGRQPATGRVLLELAQLSDPPSMTTSAKPMTATTPTTIATIRGNGDRGSASPRRIARSFASQPRKLIAEIKMPSAMSGSPISRRPPGRSKGGSSWVIANPAVMSASDVRIHARNVRSFA